MARHQILQGLLFRFKQTIPPIVLESFSFMLYLSYSPYESCCSSEGGDILSVIDEIRKKIIDKEYEFTIPHFFEEMAADDLEFADVKRAIETGRTNRKFTRDPRGTRYEIVGRSTDERQIGIICRIKSTGKLLFITVYAL